MASATIAELLTIGSNASFDPTKLSTSTLQSVVSHIKTLKRNGISIDEQTLTIDTERLLDRLYDKKGNLLNDAYKRQIGMTIKRLFPQADISLQQYNRAHNESRKRKTRTSSDTFMNSVRVLRDATLNIIQDVYIHKRVDDLGQYDACLGVLLTLCTSLRIEEVRHLKLTHIEKIRDNQPIGIKSKQSYATRVISPNNLLDATFTTILKQRPYVVHSINVKKADYATKHQLERVHDGYIIISTADYMRKKLHEVAAAAGVKFESLGFTVFRKLTTTVLIEGGGFLTAQTMNNHSSLNTTLEHYNMMTSKSVQQTYDHLAESILQNTKIPSAQNTIDALNSESTPPSSSSSSSSPPRPQSPQPSTSTSDMRPPTTIRVPKAKLVNSETAEELASLKRKIAEQSKNLAEIIQIKNELSALKNAQHETEVNANAEIQQLKAQFDTIPMKIEQQLERIKDEAGKQLTLEFNAAVNRLSLESKQIETLRESLNQKLSELQSHGVDNEALLELSNEFQNKITNIESSCITAQQLKTEYDAKINNLETFITTARQTTSNPEKISKLAAELQANLKSNMSVRTRGIRNQIAKVSKDLNNLKQLFGIEHQNELKALEIKAANSQSENERKFEALNDELIQLRNIIVQQQQQQQQTEPKRKRPRITPPFETPPYSTFDARMTPTHEILDEDGDQLMTTTATLAPISNSDDDEDEFHDPL
nr:VLF-1 protein [Oryctes rhinoceros nudivirus]